MSVCEKNAKTLEELEKIAISLREELIWGKFVSVSQRRMFLTKEEHTAKSAEYHSELWIRLDDHRRELAAKDRELEELKQKLQQILKHCEPINRPCHAPPEKTLSEYCEEWEEWFEELVGLLKK